MSVDNETIRYVAGMAGITALGISAMIVDGSIGETIAIAAASAVGYLINHYNGGESVGSKEEIQVKQV
jgi:NADPH-dependent curcumin reductase CurA